MAKKKSQVSRQTLWQRRHREMGLCVVCSEAAYKGWRCVKHYEQHKITMRLRYIPKVRGRYDVGGASEFRAAADREAARKEKRRAATGDTEKQKPAETEPGQPNASKSAGAGRRTSTFRAG